MSGKSKYKDWAEWRWEQYGPYEGPRPFTPEGLGIEDEAVVGAIREIWGSMKELKFLGFSYSGSKRVVAPFVLGASRDGNVLLRGWQLMGVSKSGKGPGWRVYQVSEMSDLEPHGEWFDPEQYDFDRYFPWTYYVFKSL